MKKTGKLLAALITALSLAMPVNVWADTKISSISLKIDSSIEAGDSSNDVEVTTSSRYCSVDDVEVTNEPSDEWKNGARPKIKVTLSSGGDAYFGTGINKSDISVSGNDANVTSVSRSGKYELTVNLTLEKLERDSDDYELDVTELNWDDYDAPPAGKSRKMQSAMRYVSTGMAAAFLLPSPPQIPVITLPAILQEAAITPLRCVLFTILPIKVTGKSLMN